MKNGVDLSGVGNPFNLKDIENSFAFKGMKSNELLAAPPSIYYEKLTNKVQDFNALFNRSELNEFSLLSKKDIFNFITIKRFSVDGQCYGDENILTNPLLIGKSKFYLIKGKHLDSFLNGVSVVNYQDILILNVTNKVLKNRENLFEKITDFVDLIEPEDTVLYVYEFAPTFFEGGDPIVKEYFTTTIIRFCDDLKACACLFLCGFSENGNEIKVPVSFDFFSRNTFKNSDNGSIISLDWFGDLFTSALVFFNLDVRGCDKFEYNPFEIATFMILSVKGLYDKKFIVNGDFIHEKEFKKIMYKILK